MREGGHEPVPAHESDVFANKGFNCRLAIAGAAKRFYGAGP